MSVFIGKMSVITCLSQLGLPEQSTTDEVAEAIEFISSLSWRLGVKVLAKLVSSEASLSYANRHFLLHVSAHGLPSACVVPVSFCNTGHTGLGAGLVTFLFLQ